MALSVAIAGAGPVGRATAAYLAHHGGAVSLWSPSGNSTRALVQIAHGGRGRLRYEGALQGAADIGIVTEASSLSHYDVVLIALPGHAYPTVLPQIVPHLHAGQMVIVSGALSLAPLWIYERAGQPGARPDRMHIGLCEIERMADRRKPGTLARSCRQYAPRSQPCGQGRAPCRTAMAGNGHVHGQASGARCSRCACT